MKMKRNCEMCDKEFITTPSFVRQGDGKFCSRICYGKSRCLKLTGKKFARLLLIDPAGKNRKGELLWNCICDCGQSHVASGPAIQSGRIKSCGCLKIERDRNRCNENGNGYKHGGKSKNSKYRHIYATWIGHLRAIINPKNPAHKYYSGMAIEAEWDDRIVSNAAYPNFEKYVLGFIGDRPSIDYSMDIIEHWRGFVKGNIRELST
jgi:hypothetical protein